MRHALPAAIILLGLIVAPHTFAQLQNPTSGQAPEPAPSACDPDYYETLEARAWLEAQREITQNQNLITKPDSVLQYTCFDKHLGALNKAAQEMFSGESEGGSISGGGGGSSSSAAPSEPSNTQAINTALEEGRAPPATESIDLATGTDTASAISAASANSGSGNPSTQVAETATSNYLLNNFTGSTSTFRGGKSYNSYQSGTPAAAAYNCTTMNAIWKQARCSNFIESAAADGFFTLAQYVESPDKRFPVESCTQNPEWKTNYDSVTKKEPEGGYGTKWIEDTVTAYYSNLDDSKKCGESIIVATGLTVKRKNAEPYEYNEKVCLSAGCYYKPSSANSGKCEKNDN